MTITRSEVIRRAWDTANQNCIYKLGAGGMDPTTLRPWNKSKQCDCTGWLAWVLGVSRKTDHPFYKNQNGGWFETTAIYRDALSPFGFAQAIPFEDLRPGDAVVKPDRGGRQGHVRLVLKTPVGEQVEIMDCSSFAYETLHDAISWQAFDIGEYLPVRFAWVVDKKEKPCAEK